MVFKTPSVTAKVDNECPSTQFIEPGAYYPSSFVPQEVTTSTGRYGAFYAKTSSKFLGVCLIFMSWLSAAGAILALMSSAATAWLATGFWCGAFVSLLIKLHRLATLSQYVNKFLMIHPYDHNRFDSLSPVALANFPSLRYCSYSCNNYKYRPKSNNAENKK